MEENLIDYKTAKIAKEKKFNVEVCNAFTITNNKVNEEDSYQYNHNGNLNLNPLKHNLISEAISRPTQALLQKWIREIRNTHIEIHRNASGYYWSMCKSDGGTDLGWSDLSGPNDGGVWNSFEEALENALAIQLTYDLPDNTTEIKHWGNYAELAIQKYNIMKEKN